MKKHEYKTFDECGDLKKGDLVRQFKSKLRKTVTGPVGKILDFVDARKKDAAEPRWRAFVAFDNGEDPYDKFVDVELLRKEPEPLQSNAWSNPEDAPEGAVEHKFDDPHCDCGGDLKFDPDIVGDTCGGLTLIGWDVCVKCGKAWLSAKCTTFEGKWKIAGGGRSVETGVGRIRVDGAKDPLTLMARIAKLPELELEVAQLRKRLENQPSPNEAVGTRVEAAVSPWKEAQLVVNGIELKDGDRILLINQPEAIGNGVRVIRLERPEYSETTGYTTTPEDP